MSPSCLAHLEAHLTTITGEKGSIGDGMVSYGLTDPEDISLSSCMPPSDVLLSTLSDLFVGASGNGTIIGPPETAFADRILSLNIYCGQVLCFTFRRLLSALKSIPSAPCRTIPASPRCSAL